MRIKGVSLAVVSTFIVACASEPIATLEEQSRRSKPTASCADFPSFDPLSVRPPDQKIADHVIRVNKDGVLIDSVSKDNLSNLNDVESKSAADYVTRILCNAVSLAKGRTSDRADNEPLRVPVLIYIHGGLNTFGSTDRRILNKKMPEAIMCNGDVMCQQRDDTYYPVFVSWPSSPWSSWVDHTFRIREGRKTDPWIGVLGSPLVIATDLLSIVGRYPSTLYTQVVNEKDRFASLAKTKWLSQAWETSIRRFCNSVPKEEDLRSPDGECQTEPKPGEHYDVDRLTVEANLSSYFSNTGERFTRGSTWLLTAPVRYTLFSIWLSGPAVPAWENMKRRTVNMFYPPHFFDNRFPEDEGAPGGRFFERLLEFADQQAKQDIHLEVTLVGHSMGAIVLNNTIDQFQFQWAESGIVKNIVYMAGAASIAESLDSLSPLLLTASKLNKPINFYNLTLNRVAEVSERHLAAALPLGSLLISIDQHYDTPEHSLLRTIGSEVNVLSALDVIDYRLRDSTGDLVFKSFDRIPDGDNKYPGSRDGVPYKKLPSGSRRFWRYSVLAQLDVADKQGS